MAAGAGATLIHGIGVGDIEVGLVRVEVFVGFTVPSGECCRSFSSVAAVVVPVVFLVNAADST